MGLTRALVNRPVLGQQSTDNLAANSHEDAVADAQPAKQCLEYMISEYEVGFLSFNLNYIQCHTNVTETNNRFRNKPCQVLIYILGKREDPQR
jgi:predicted secreted protein